jgi:hypothetical protein
MEGEEKREGGKEEREGGRRRERDFDSLDCRLISIKITQAFTL